MLAKLFFTHPRYLSLVILTTVLVGYSSFNALGRQEDPTITMVGSMLQSDQLVDGTLTFLKAIAENGGPIFEAATSLMTVWAESVKMAEQGEDGAYELVKEALVIQGGWDVIVGPSTRRRVMQMVQEKVEKIKEDRDECLQSDFD